MTNPGRRKRLLGLAAKDGRESSPVAGRPSPAVSSGTLHDEIERLRRPLGEPEVSPIERLLIDQVVICYLRMNLTEQYYQSTMNEGCSIATASYWERKLSAVQGRYLRAIETLARVRKLMGVPMVQINIAAEGGQQVVSNA